MEQNQNNLNNYLETLPAEIGNENTELIKKWLPEYRASRYNPSIGRCKTTITRLKTVCKIVKKPLTTLTKSDITILNNEMRDRGMRSENDYRKALKLFLKHTDELKFFSLLRLECMGNTVKKADEEKSVDAEKFWTEEQCQAYLKQSTNYSPRQQAFAALWLTSAMRPCELLELKKKDFVFTPTNGKEASLMVNIQKGKTGKRTFPYYGNEAETVWQYIKPHWETLKPEEKLFCYGYNMQKKIHLKICNRIELPADKPRIFYIMRKQNASRLYQKYGLGACKILGHRPDEAKTYFDITPENLLGKGFVTLAKQNCLHCHTVNEPFVTGCVNCGAPLSPEKYAALTQQKTTETEIRMKELECKMALMEDKLSGDKNGY